MGEVLSLTVPFFAIILAGFAMGKLTPRPAAGLEWLNMFILYLANPALFFQLLAATPFSEISNVAFIGTVMASITTILLAGFLLALATGRDVATATIKALIGAYANNGYLGPALAISALGTAAAVPVALIFAFENTMFFVLAPIAMAFSAGAHQSAGATARAILRRVFTHPFILAVIAGALAAAFEWQPPAMLDRVLTMLRGAAAPCALFAMGVTVALQPAPTRRTAAELAPYLTLKLVAHPVLAFALVSLSGADHLWVTTAVLMAALPPASNVFILATQYRTFTEGASNAILVGTATSALTVTAVLYAIRAGVL